MPSRSAAGPNSALAHYRVTPESNRVLEAGSVYLVDSGGQYLDATTDVTRTIAIGEPDPEIRRRFTLVLKSHIAVARAVFPQGANGAQLDGLARRPLWQAGLDFDHGTGHGIGSYLCVHEGPARIAKTAMVALKPGMILSDEPGYYKAGAYGIRTENLLAVVPRGTPEGGERELLGFENLTRAPIDRRLIIPELLDAEEGGVEDGEQGAGRDIIGEAGADQAAGRGADVVVELVDGELVEELIDRAKGADLVGRPGHTASGKHQRGLARLHRSLVARCYFSRLRSSWSTISARAST